MNLSSILPPLPPAPFQGNSATGDCCSRCWDSIHPKDDATTKKGSEDAPEKAKAIVEETQSQIDSVEVLAAAPSASVVKKTPLAKAEVTAAADKIPSPAKKKKKKA